MDFPACAARDAVALALALALAEDGAQDDGAQDDVTTRWSVPAGLPAKAEITAKQPGVISGLSIVSEVLITGERAVLNFLQRICGIATLTKQYVDLVADLGVKVLDTRKTAPGLRALDKHAVASGGGSSHRLDLSAMVLDLSMLLTGTTRA
ncbi:hypothetical protein [Streptomyces sp. NPDC021622]|uniref:nicotinate-nucleotide diphosphorylase n=1 Tax=Streptomyces sp. NPDC021622 TaxID=3155013 RepID=UPI0033C0E8E1